MPSIHETAYPRLKSNPSPRELVGVYTPTREEMALADRVARSGTARLGFLILLKTFQRLGYFVPLRDVPLSVVEHIARDQGFLAAPANLAEYDNSGTRRRHVPIIRDHQRVLAFDAGGRHLLARSVREAAQTKEELADIINVAIEELVRASYELPGFTTLLEEAQRGRAAVNRAWYMQVNERLGPAGRAQIDRLWQEAGVKEGTTAWHTLKQDPGSPTLTHLKELIRYHHWLKAQQPGRAVLDGVPASKLRQFAAEARSLDAARMHEMEPHKRYTLAAVLLASQHARTLDDLGKMFLKRINAHTSSWQGSAGAAPTQVAGPH